MRFATGDQMLGYLMSGGESRITIEEIGVSRSSHAERSIRVTIPSSLRIRHLSVPYRKCLDDYPVASSYLADASIRSGHGGRVVGRRCHRGRRIGPHNVLCDRISHPKNDDWHYDGDSCDYCHDNRQ